MKKKLRGMVSFCVKLLPSPDYIYNVLLAPKPLRYVTTKILQSLIPESIELPEGTFYLDRKDPRISGSLALGLYEKFESQLIRATLRPGMTVINVGGHLGYYAFIASKHVGENGKVIVFEPEPHTFELLLRNTRDRKNVECYQEAASSKNGEMTLHLSTINSGAHTLVPLSSLHNSVTVKTVTIDSKIKNADLLIMDVEGAEPFVFAGMPELLKKNIILIFELNPELIRIGGNDPIAMLRMLHSEGFLIYNINSEKEKLTPVTNIEEFVGSLNKSQIANLYCTKALTGQEIGIAHEEAKN